MRTVAILSTALATCAVTIVVIGVIALGPATQVLAQPEAQGDQGAPPDEGFQPRPQPGFQPRLGGPGGPGGPGGFGGPGFNLRTAGLRGGGALAVSGEHVFVLYGNTLYQFAADDLKLIKKVTLQQERPFGPPGGWSGGFGPRPERRWGEEPRPGERPRRDRPLRERPDRRFDRPRPERPEGPQAEREPAEPRDDRPRDKDRDQ